MKRLLLSAFLSTAFVDAPGAAEEPPYYVSGADLADGAKAMRRYEEGRASSDDLLQVTKFVGIVTAAHDVWFLSREFRKEGRAFCTNMRVRSDQLATVVARHVLENPKKWHLPGTAIVFDALVAAFPCSDPPSSRQANPDARK